MTNEILRRFTDEGNDRFPYASFNFATGLYDFHLMRALTNSVKEISVVYTHGDAVAAECCAIPVDELVLSHIQM